MAEELDPFKAAPIVAAAGMNEQMSYAILGAVATTTRAFGDLRLKIDVATQRVFVSVVLRRWAKYKRFKVLRDFWIKKAEARAVAYLPQAWRILVYYE